MEMPEIPEPGKGLVPLISTVVVFMFTTYGGAIFWIATLKSDVVQAQRDIAQERRSSRELYALVLRLDRRTIRMAEHMGLKDEPVVPQHSPYGTDDDAD